MATKKIRWNYWWEKWSNFQPKQLQAEQAIDKYDYVFYGGAAGPGKSYFLRHYPIKFLIETCFHKLGLRGVRFGLFCEDYPALHDRHLTRLPYEFPTWLGTYKAQSHEYVLDERFGGGILAFRNLDDPSKYLSSEFGAIGVDELTKNKKETFDFLRLRLRWPGLDHPKFIGASNPGGIGHEWVKRLWVDRNFSPDEKQAEQFHFVKALPSDNQYLPKTYYETLSSLPEKLRKAYRDGNWDVFEGQYFSEWDVNKHVIQPFEIPRTWKRFRAYDYGYDNPACCKWYALDHDGRVWVYRELYYPKGHKTDAERQAQDIVRLSGDEEYAYSIADPAIFSPTGIVDKSGGQTIAETFARHGIVFMPGSNRRVDGWSLMHRYLYWDATTQPKLIYFTTCKDSIRTIPNLIHDEIRPEDLDTDGEDHAADPDRYLLVSLHERTAGPLKTEVEKKLEAMKQEGGISPQNLNNFYYE